jgi:arylsulfatase A-like enzyme
MDLTASILAATGTPVPADASLEGVNIFPVLQGRAPELERTLFWRVLLSRTQRAVRSGNWKLVIDVRPMLFNLRDDVGERRNLIGGQTAIARDLMRKLEAWNKEVGAGTTPNAAAGRS